MKVSFVCPKCGKEPPKDKKMSTENWAVIPAKCPKCKVKLQIKVGK